MQVTNRTEARWPPADVVVEYLRDAAEELGDHVALGATITHLQRPPSGGDAGGFAVTVGLSSGGSKQVHCGKVGDAYAVPSLSWLTSAIACPPPMTCWPNRVTVSAHILGKDFVVV